MATRKKKTRRRRDPSSISPEDFIDAVPGTGGVLKDLAEKLDTSRAGVEFCLSRTGPAWDEARAAFREESDSVSDAARNTIQELMEQREDLALAARVAKWYLERKESEEFESKRKAETVVVDRRGPPTGCISLEDLDLSLEVRKEILAAIVRRSEKNGS